MTRYLIILSPFFISVSAPAAEKEAPHPNETSRIVKLTIRPTAQPQPAMKYRLLPELLDQTPGNAATLLLTAVQMVASDAREEFRGKYEDWMKVASKDLPAKEVRQTLDKFKSALRQVELAALREKCDWDLPVRSEGFRMQLPPLGKMRTLSRLLAVRIRLHVAEGDSEAALRDLRIGFAMARHIADGPSIIQQLVARAIASTMVERVEELIDTDSSPNLYWALTDLPSPLISLRQGFRYEGAVFFLHFPQLRNPRTAELTRAQWKRLAYDEVELIKFLQNASPLLQQETDELLDELYPPAKRYLLGQGQTAEQVEAMPREQVVAIHQIDRFVYWRDEMFKWLNVPYWQAWKGIEEMSSTFNKAVQEGQDDSRTLAAVLLPSLGKAYTLMVRLDRRIAGLRCIEAIRLYARKHNGKLPASLGEITNVPIPLDPVTGKAFRYEIDGDHAVLELFPSHGLAGKDGVRYELTVAR